MRTTPVAEGTVPYNWGSSYLYECTWFAYYRCGEADTSLSYPCWWDRATKTGSYTDAKDWLENYRDPWVPKGTDYTPVAHDIVVFDGAFGHVAFIEKVDNGVAVLSQYMSGDPNSFSNYAWKIGTDYTGKLLGYLHYPDHQIPTAERDPSEDQIQTTDITLRIREKPSLDAEIIGHVQLGYYNILNKEENDGYTWYQIAENGWCADITTVYLPSDKDDIIKQIEKYFDDMKAQVNTLKEQDAELKSRLKKIKELADYE